MKTVVAVDLSLTCTGIARVHAPDHDWRTAQIKTDKKSYAAGHQGSVSRMNYIRMRLAQVAVDFTGGPAPDLFVLEGPSYSSNHGSAHERGGLWWHVYMWMAQNAPTLVIPPTCRAKYATGKVGSKAEVMAAAIRRYPDVDIVDDNTADAAVLAAMGARYVQAPIERAMPKSHLSAMDKLSID